MATGHWPALGEKMEYKIKINISESDYKIFCFDNMFQKKLGLIVSICVVLFGLIISIVDFILTKKISSYMTIFLFIIIFIVIFMVLLLQKLKKIYKTDTLLHEGYLLKISENEIKDETERGSLTFKNQDFTNIIFGKKIIALYISEQKAVLIPRHCFTSTEEEKEIEEFLKQNYVKKNN